MRKIISLVQRDLLLIKKYCFVLFLLEIAVPVLCAYKAPVVFEFGCTVFALTYFFTAYMAIQSIAIAETKYPKAESTLCAAPYSRKQIVIGRYLFIGILFAVSIAIYGIVSLLIPAVSMVSVMDVLITLLIGAVVIGVILPVQYRLGYERMKYFYMAIIIAIPVIIPLIGKLLSTYTMDFFRFLKLPLLAKGIICFIVAAWLILESMLVSIKVYSEKEL